jgi:hypothetical protein
MQWKVTESEKGFVIPHKFQPNTSRVQMQGLTARQIRSAFDWRVVVLPLLSQDIAVNMPVGCYFRSNVTCRELHVSSCGYWVGEHVNS